MKGFLAYLTIVLGLGLTFSDNAQSNDKIFCIIKTSNPGQFIFIPIDESEIYKLKNSKYDWKTILGKTSISYPLTKKEKKELKFCDLKVYNSNYDAYWGLNKQWGDLGGFNGTSLIHHKNLAYYLGDNLYSSLLKNNNSQIFKREIVKKKKVVEKKKVVKKEPIEAECKEQIGWDGEVRSWIKCLNKSEIKTSQNAKAEPSKTYDIQTWFTYNRWYKSNKRMTEYANEVHHKINHKGYCSMRNKVTKCKTIYFAIIDREMRKKFPSYNFRKSKFIEILQEEKTQIAKKERAEKKKVVKKEQPKKKKVVKKETTNVINSRKIKKIIKIDNKEPVKENISSWEKNVLLALDREKNDPYCEVKDKISLKSLSSSKEKNLSKSFKKNYCIKKSDLLQLGEFKKLNLPNFIMNEIKGCQTNVCIGQHAGKKVYELFVRRGPIYHARYPGKMINGMVWFEILYYEKFRKLQKILTRYEENKYEGINKLRKANHEKQIYSLIKLNKGRIKMREALGFTLYDDTIKVIESQWLLAEFLNKDKLTVSRVKLSPEMHKRKLLIEKYKTLLAKYKKKLEEEKAKKNKS